MKEQPEYYNKNGFSPIDAFKQGLISREEYIGFIKGNIIKYTVRAGHKNGGVPTSREDIHKAIHYLEFLEELLEEWISLKPVTVQ